MATPPTFEAEYETAWSTVAAGAKTASVTVGVGDVLVVCGITESNTYTLATPTGGGLTYTLQQSVVTADYTACYVWTAVSASSQTFTLSITMSGGTGYWGFNALRFSATDGVGASTKTNVLSGAPSLALTTGTDNAAIVVANGDWNATDGASRTWRTINSITPTSGNGLENSYARDASRAAFYVARWNDAGTAASKTTGLSAPSGQKYSIIAVEVKGTAGGGTDATATPATVATTSTLPRPAGNVTAGPAALATVGALPRPAGNVAAGPSTVASTATLPRPAVNVVAAPTALATSTTLPQSIPAVAGNATATPATVATSVTLPRPAGNVAAAPAAVTTAATLPRPAVNVAAAPTALATVAALPRPAVNTAAGPATAATTAALPRPAADVAVGATVVPTTTALPAPSVGGSTVATPATVTSTTGVPRPAVNVAAGPASVATVATLPLVLVNPGEGIVHRPNTGTTARPSTGTITRPFTGVVSRP